MTLRVGFVGNSHMVSISEAWRSHPGRWPGLDPVFHAFRGTTVSETRLDGLSLVPETDHATRQMLRLNGTERIDLSGAEAYVIVGFHCKTEHVLHLWRSARWPGLPSLAREEDLARLDVPLISRQAALASLTRTLAETSNLTLASALRRASGRRVLTIGEPRVHARALSSRLGRFLGLTAALRSGDGAALSGLFERAAESAARLAGAQRIAQPAGTVARHLLTRAEFMAGEIHVTTETGRRVRRADEKHPNAAWGALMLDEISAALAG